MRILILATAVFPMAAFAENPTVKMADKFIKCGETAPESESLSCFKNMIDLVQETLDKSQSFTSCAKVNAELDRLACYDREIGLTPTMTAEKPSGSWSVSTEKSDFEDTQDVFMMVESEDVVACGRFGSPKRATLTVRCMENTTAVYLSTSCHLASGFQGYGTVDVRIDDEKSFESNMDASTDNSALGHWRGGGAIPFAKRMMGKDKILFRFTPFNESRVTAMFDISGFDQASEQLRKACKW